MIISTWIQTEVSFALVKVSDVITAYCLDDFNITFDLVPVNGEPIYLTGHTTGHTMNLEVGGKSLKWKRKLTLRSEKNFLIPNRDTKEAIERTAQPRSAPYPKS
jgi:hypothetical protein